MPGKYILGNGLINIMIQLKRTFANKDTMRMTNFTTNLNKRLFTILIVAIGFAANTYSQNNIDFALKVDTIPGVAKVNITISVLKGESNYVFSIATEAPWKGGTIVKESPVQNEKKFTFENIPYGKYFIMVRNGANNKASYQYLIVPTQIDSKP